MLAAKNAMRAEDEAFLRNVDASLMHYVTNRPEDPFETRFLAAMS